MISGKEVLTALKTVGEYCNERECDKCIFSRANGCILIMEEPPGFDDVAEDLKGLTEE